MEGQGKNHQDHDDGMDNLVQRAEHAKSTSSERAVTENRSEVGRRQLKSGDAWEALMFQIAHDGQATSNAVNKAGSTILMGLSASVSIHIANLANLSNRTNQDGQENSMGQVSERKEDDDILDALSNQILAGSNTSQVLGLMDRLAKGVQQQMQDLQKSASGNQS